jgi:hypothetical protein
MLEQTDFTVFNNPDLSTECETLTSYLNFCFNICCPVESILVKPDRVSSACLKRLRRQKETAYKTGDRDKVKLLSQSILAETQRLEKLYAKILLGDGSCKQMWVGLKTLCGKKSHNQTIDFDLNELNREFAKRRHPSSDMPFLYPETAVPQIVTSIQPSDVFVKLRKINSNKASGLDGLSPVILKECAHQLASPLALIFNRCLAQRRIADCWRNVRITPIPKAGDKFRPIACMPVMLKVLEQIISDQISSSVPLSDPSQFAYCKGRSTLDAVAALSHRVLSALDSQCTYVKLCFLDYSDAFNCVNRKKLLDKLAARGLPTHLLNWLVDYFTDRFQLTSVGNAKSELTPVLTGVLQGAILSPFLFSMYIADIPQSPDCFMSKYADDVLVGCVMSRHNSADYFQTSIHSIEAWSREFNLVLNPTKCVTLTFTFKKTIPPTRTLINHTAIDSVTSFKYLGVIFSTPFSWSPHVFHTFCKIRRLSFYVSRLKSLAIPFKALSHFIYSCVLIHWLYCSPAIFPGLLTKDFILIKRSLKCISKCSGHPARDLAEFIVSRHLSACERFARCILSDNMHPLHTALSQCISTSSTRSVYKLVPARTSTYRNSCVPYLARFLVSKEQTKSELLSRLL